MEIKTKDKTSGMVADRCFPVAGKVFSEFISPTNPDLTASLDCTEFFLQIERKF
jgi:hypothetical protein